MTRRIEDVNTSLVTDESSGWSHSGAHLITDYEIDALGRTLEELGPEHDIDLNGTNTTVRRSEWTVYDDFNETKVLATVPETSERVDSMRQALRIFMKQLGDPVYAPKTETLATKRKKREKRKS